MFAPFKTAAPTVKWATALILLALASFAFPFCMGGYVERLGIFFVLYFVLLIPATALSIIAICKRQWSYPLAGKLLLLVLYIPTVFLLCTLRRGTEDFVSPLTVTTTNAIPETNVVSAINPEKAPKAQSPKSPLTNSGHKSVHYSAAISSDGKVAETNFHPTATNGF